MTNLRKLIVITLLLLGLGGTVYVINSRVIKKSPKPSNFDECAKLRGSIIQESYPEVCVTEDGQRFVREISNEEKQKLHTPTPDRGNERNDGCIVTGCSGQVCADEEVVTTCEWREEYSCYAEAVCERQKDGECDWTQTEESEACLSDVTSTPAF